MNLNCLKFLILSVILTESNGTKLKKDIDPDTGFSIRSHKGRSRFYFPSSDPKIWHIKPTTQMEGYYYHVKCRSNFQVGSQTTSGFCRDNKLIFKYGANQRVVCGTHKKTFKITIKSKYMLRIVFVRGSRSTGNTGFHCRVAYDSKYLCPKLYQIVNGKVWHRGKTQVGSKAFFHCDRGFKLVGKNVETNCMANGRWNLTDIPSCQRITCPRIPNLLHNGKTIQNKMSAPGDVATFQCNRGYNLVGNATKVTCGHRGFWWPRNTRVFCVP